MRKNSPQLAAEAPAAEVPVGLEPVAFVSARLVLGDGKVIFLKNHSIGGGGGGNYTTG